MQIQPAIFPWHVQISPVHIALAGSGYLAVARQQGIEFRLKKSVRARAVRREEKQGYWQESEIKETEAISIEPHKDQGKKKSFSHCKKSLLKTVHYIAQNHLKDSLTRIKGKRIRITKKSAEKIPVLL